MRVKRSIPIIINADESVYKTLVAYRDVMNRLSGICFNGGKFLRKVPLHNAGYHKCKGVVSSQMVCFAERKVAGFYTATIKNKRRPSKPVVFVSPRADFLIRDKGSDASFPMDGSLSLWTVDGRKRYSYTVPKAFQNAFQDALKKDSLCIYYKDGKMQASLCVSLEAPEPHGKKPVGVDRGEKNSIVAVDLSNRVFFETGKSYKVRNKRSFKKVKRLQKKFNAKKAQKGDTHSLRRALKRLKHKRKHRTTDFCRRTAKRFVDWLKPNSIIVFENLKGITKQKRFKCLNRRLGNWPHYQLRTRIINKAEMRGIPWAEVDPSYTSKTCSRCGSQGNRDKNKFSCDCGYKKHADVNAAINIRTKFTEGVKASSSQ